MRAQRPAGRASISGGACAPIGVIIVHRDQPQRCAMTVKAFQAQPVPVHITVVDCGSHQSDLSRLLESSPGIEILRLGYNAGFGPGANAGLRRWLLHDEGEWVVVAPHDAAPEQGCLRRLLDEVMARPDVGLASAEFGPGFEYKPAVDWMIGGFYRPTRRGSGWEEADYPHGTLLLARRATLVDVGLFDERYFAYCEEVDLGLRARRRGWQVGIVWGAVVGNDRLPERTVADYLQLRNTLLLVRTWFGRYPATMRGLYGTLRIAYRTVVRRSKPLKGLTELCAVTDFLTGRFGPPPRLVLAAARRAGAPGGGR